MKTNNSPYTAGRFLRVFSGLVLTTFLCVAFSAQNALAVTTYGRAFLINTEAFDTIDDGDAASNIELRFGDSTRTLLYDVTLSAFVFSGNVYIRGTLSGNVLHAEKTLTSSGTLTFEGQGSGQNLYIQRSITGSHLTVTKTFGGAGLSNCPVGSTLNWLAATKQFSCNSLPVTEAVWVSDAVTTSLSNITDNVSIGATAAKARLDVIGTISGSRLSISGNANITGAILSVGNITTRGTFSGKTLRVGAGGADIHGALNVTGSILTEGDLTLGGDDAAADVILTFMNSGTDETLSWLESTDKFQFSDDISIVGSISGSSLTIDNSATISGTLLVKNALTSKATVSGTDLYASQSLSGKYINAANTFAGAGLTNCTGLTSKLTWLSATKRFSCENDETGGSSGGNWSNTGSLLNFFNSKYVNTSGDTMTGALTIDLLNTGAGTGLIMREKAYFGSGVTLSGALVFQSIGSQSIAPNGNLKSFVTNVAGRPLESNRGPSGAQYQLQPSLFSKLIMMLSTGGGTTVNGYGTTVTNDTTVSHPTPDEVFGYMTNFATSTTNNDTAGTSSINTTWFRGSTTGANGFFFKARVGVVDTTSIRVFTGLINQTIATAVGADSPTGHSVGFQFSTNRGDANWQFQTKDNTTQNVVNTGIPFTASKVYELSFYCTAQCTSVTWQVNNVTDGTVASGSTSSNLPGTSTALRMVHGVSTLTTAAKNIRMQSLYSEADR